MPTKDVEKRHIVVEDNLPLATPSIVYGGGAVRKTRTELIQSRQKKHSRYDWEDRDTENPL